MSLIATPPASPSQRLHDNESTPHSACRATLAFSDTKNGKQTAETKSTLTDSERRLIVHRHLSSDHDEGAQNSLRIDPLSIETTTTIVERPLDDPTARLLQLHYARLPDTPEPSPQRDLDDTKAPSASRQDPTDTKPTADKRKKAKVAKSAPLATGHRPRGSYSASERFWQLASIAFYASLWYIFPLAAVGVPIWLIFYSSYWYLMLAYSIWFAYDWHSPWTGGRRLVSSRRTPKLIVYMRAARAILRLPFFMLSFLSAIASKFFFYRKCRL